MALFNWMFMRAASLVPVYGWWLLIFWALPAAVGQAGESSTDFNLRIAATVAIGFIWLWAVFELSCLRGTEGPSAYGPDPLPP